MRFRPLCLRRWGSPAAFRAGLEVEAQHHRTGEAFEQGVRHLQRAVGLRGSAGLRAALAGGRRLVGRRGRPSWQMREHGPWRAIKGHRAVYIGVIGSTQLERFS